MKKFIISFVLSSLLASSIAPKVSATFEGTPVEPQYTAITEYFDNPIVLEFDDSYAVPSQIGVQENSIQSYSSLPSSMWGAYNATDNTSYLQINSGTNITFRGQTNDNGYVFASPTPSTILYDVTQSTYNFHLRYTGYYRLTSSGYTYYSGNLDIWGNYYSSTKTFEIYGVTYYYQ